MHSDSQNIFSQAILQQKSHLIETITENLKSFASLFLSKAKDIMSQIKLSSETTEKLSIESQKVKQVLKQNKEAIFGISLVTLLFIVKQKISEKKRKQQRFKHIHSLASSPNNQRKRSAQYNQKNKNSKKQQKKNFKIEMLGMSKFISEEEDQESGSDNESKDCPQLSTSTRRTESVVSDIEFWNKRKPKKLEPILDQVEQQEQQDRVFFEMYRTYRQA